MDFDLNLVVRITGEKDFLNFHVIDATVFLPTWKVLDPKYTITNPDLARFYVAEVAKSQIGKKVLGSGWKTVTRRFPVVRVLTQDYVVVFDPSEI